MLMIVLTNVCAVLYFLGAFNHYSMTKGILYLSKTKHSDNYARWQAIVWPYYVLDMMLAMVFSGPEDDNDEE